jgi:DNA-binding LacI/PurR family transcriptional regulator
VDGFILMTSERKHIHIDRLLEIGAPFIAWGVGADRYCSICGDNRRGGRLATDRLVGIGRKRIAFIGGPEIEGEVAGRYLGWTEALHAVGREVDDRLIAYGDYLEESGSLAMAELLDRDPEIDGVFVCSDLMAIGAIQEAKRRGLRVPEDIAVVGYDDLLISSHVSPALTTISQNIPFAGQALARELVAYVKSGKITCTTLPVELVIRESA